MAVSNLVALAIATLVFYILVSPVAVFCSIRHGIKRRGPWYFMVLLVLIRIIGEPMLIASGGTLQNNGVSIAGYILSNIGATPLLLMVGTTLQLVNASLAESGHTAVLPPRLVRIMGLVPVAALVTSIVGSTNAYSDDPSDRSTAHTLLTVASALYLVYWALLALTCALLYRVRHAFDGRRVAVFFAASAAAMPFLLVRVIGQALSTFGSTQQAARNYGDIWIKAFMYSLMEFVVVLVMLTGGLLADKKPRDPPAGRYAGDTDGSYAEMGGRGSDAAKVQVQGPQYNGSTRY